MSLDVGSALLGASAVHLGFQVTVSALVYPALAETPSDLWPAAHAAHSRRITWVVGPLYVLVAAACVWALLTGPTPWQWVALVGNALAALTTAFVAAPLHGRLGGGPDPDLVLRLRRADAVRTVGAAVAAVSSLVALS